jgi:hypothetical protein
MKSCAAILCVLACAAGGCGRLAPAPRASDQIAGWFAEGSARNSFTLSDLHDLPPWTALYVFSPYTPTTEIQKTLGFEWADAGRFNMDMREGVNLAVFVSSNAVVRVEEWHRDRFECGHELAGRQLRPSMVIRIRRETPRPVLTIAEPDAQPNGGPAMPSGNSDGAGGDRHW